VTVVSRAAARLVARLPRDPLPRTAALAAAAALALAVSIAGLVVAVSLIDTGAFVIDSAPAPGAPEQPSPYFHLAAGALLAGLAAASACVLFARFWPRAAG